jgi:hypothetical protein
VRAGVLVELDGQQIAARRGAALVFGPLRIVSGISLFGAEKIAAQWEGMLQEVQSDVREEYDQRMKEGISCAWPSSTPRGHRPDRQIQCGRKSNGYGSSNGCRLP